MRRPHGRMPREDVQSSHYIWPIRNASEELKETLQESSGTALEAWSHGILSTELTMQAVEKRSAEHAETVLASWYKTVYGVLLQTLGRKRCRHDGRQQSWYNAEVQSLRRTVDCLRTALDSAEKNGLVPQNELSLLWQKYEAMNRQFIRVSRRERTEYQRRLNSDLQKAKKEGELKRFWTIMK